MRRLEVILRRSFSIILAAILAISNMTKIAGVASVEER